MPLYPREKSQQTFRPYNASYRIHNTSLSSSNSTNNNGNGVNALCADQYTDKIVNTCNTSNTINMLQVTADTSNIAANTNIQPVSLIGAVSQERVANSSKEAQTVSELEKMLLDDTKKDAYTQPSVSTVNHEPLYILRQRLVDIERQSRHYNADTRIIMTTMGNIQRLYEEHCNKLHATLIQTLQLCRAQHAKLIRGSKDVTTRSTQTVNCTFE